MVSPSMEKALNTQVNAELYSAYLYLSMSAWFRTLNLAGFANWMRVQAAEEMVHALKLYDFITERGGTVTLAGIEGPPTVWDSPRAVFEAAYAHEQKVTGLINALVDQALAESDHAAHIFLQWYVTEQVEEEASANDIARKLALIGSDANGLFMLDRELAVRTFLVPPGTKFAQGTAAP